MKIGTPKSKSSTAFAVLGSALVVLGALFSVLGTSFADTMGVWKYTVLGLAIAFNALALAAFVLAAVKAKQASASNPNNTA